MELDIDNNRVNQIKKSQDMTQEFIKELQNSLRNNLEHNKWDEQNFINELGKEFNIPKEHLRELNNKIEDFLESIYSNVGEVDYISYNPKTNKFYENSSTGQGMDRGEMFDEWAKSYGIGTFFIHFKDASLSDNVWYRDGNFIKEDIKDVIKDWFNNENDIENIDFSSLKEKYQDEEYIRELYEKYYDYDRQKNA